MESTANSATHALPRPYAEDLDTPCVIVDLACLERNIAEMAALAYEAQVTLRPHIKTHKTPQIAAMQLDAGAVGLTCAKVGEAEVLADAGFANLFVCYPIVTQMKARRLAALGARPGLSVSTIVDSPQGIAALSAAFAGAAEPLETLVKVNTGLGRVGVAPGAATVDLARSVEAAPGLRFGGVCAHEGFTYSLPDPEERAASARAGAEALVETAEGLSAAGLRAARVSVGATPGIDTLATVPGVTEIRPGNYVFYDAMQVGLGVATLDRCALRVLTTVVSHAARDRAVIDAGSKTLTTDQGAHGQTTAGGYGTIVGREDIHIERLSEEHGWLRLDPAGSDVEIGDTLEIVPDHGCPVAKLAHELTVVCDEAVVGRTVLGRLGPDRKTSVVQFLYESHLILKGNPIVDLENADLSEADLRLDNLSEVDLSYANLRGANLSYADLSDANLRGAKLSGAELSTANL